MTGFSSTRTVLTALIVASALAACGSPAPTDSGPAAGPVIVYQNGGLIRVAPIDGEQGDAIAPDLDAGEQVHPSWSPDGSSIVFAADDSDGTRDIWIHDVASAQTTKLFDCSMPCFWSDDPTYSPDGRAVLYERVAQAPGQSGNDGTPYLVTVKPDGAGEHVLTSGPDVVSFYVPTWSPDASQIVIEYSTFATAAADEDRQVGGAIAIVNVATGDITMLDTGAGVAGNPSWSPDGASIVFQRYDDQTDWELYSISLADATVTRITHLTESGGRVGQPAWLPDGSGIAAIWEESPGAANSRPAIVDAATGEALVIGAFGATHPHVQP